MSRRIKKNSTARGGRMAAVARQVRGLLTSLAIPTILTACAPVPHMHSSSGQAANSARTVLYVGPKEKGAAGEVAEAPQDAGDSPAGRYIPLSPDMPFFEKTLSRRRLDAQALDKRLKLARSRTVPAAAAEPPRPPRQIATISPQPAVKSLKDGIWDRMRKRLMLTGIEQERVTAEVDKIKRSPGTVGFLSKRAEPFLFYIVDEIERRGLPMDLAMVPMVESAFEPAAVSPKQAAGIWQIIPGTATENGLKLVDGYDGRYDLYASTKAALKYLARLHGMFGGDWLLALAAYNAGEGAVQRAVAANQKAGLGTSFWELELPAETKAYVPKILALSRVIADPAAHGVSLRKISPLPYLARVEVKGEAVQLAQAVAGAGMSWEEFYGLNPAFKPDVAPAAPFNLLLPLDKAELLVANLQGSRLIAARKYVVKKGETLGVIAKQQGVPPLKLAEWNGLKADSRVRPGQELIIYPV
jgi:membrane-bound lytic murein transglycosylase D